MDRNGMSKSNTQWEFLQCLADLIVYAKDMGYKFTMSRGYASEAANKADGGHPDSCHLHRLAIDLNLFVDGEFITGSHEAWDVLGEFWESLHLLARNGRGWNDANHFSFEWNGIK